MARRTTTTKLNTLGPCCQL